MQKHEIAQVRARTRLSDLVSTKVRLRRATGGYMGLCPFHNERTPSFHVNDARGTFKCFGCDAWGDVFDWLMLMKGVTFPEALAELQGSSPAPYTWSEEQRQTLRADAAKDDDKRRIAHAHGIWLKRQDIKDTLSARYLRLTRKISLAIPAILGHVQAAYCSPLEEESPALIAPLQDSAGHVTAVQQIFLCSETDDAWRDENGRRIKRTLGVMKDGCVRLGMPDTVLGLAGSVEDALAACEMFSLPVWATCGEQRMAQVWVPDEVDHLVVFADSDKAGRDAANAVVERHYQKRAVQVEIPKGAKDWSEVLMQRVPA